jgi:hypothetical protein
VTLRTSYEFTLPRGYVDGQGRVHKTGRMRLATARDELEPLRDPTVQGPDDPRLTILVLTRVVEELGSLDLVTSYDIEGLFAVDLAFLQDFYGVINFGSQEEYDALVNAQASSSLLGVDPAAAPTPTAGTADPEPVAAAGSAEPTASTDPGPRPNLRRAVEEIPRKAQ